MQTDTSRHGKVEMSESGRVTVTRRIEAPSDVVFGLLADPVRHPDFDGSGMVVDGSGNDVISCVGDRFLMKMHNDEMGDYEMANVVVEYEKGRRIVWEPELAKASRPEDQDSVGHSLHQRWGYELQPDGPDVAVVTELFDCSGCPEWFRAILRDGDRWLEDMERSLEKLDACSRA